jgi:hypothetical protein
MERVPPLASYTLGFIPTQNSQTGLGCLEMRSHYRIKTPTSIEAVAGSPH